MEAIATGGVIVQRDVMVAMPDGVELATDVYLPAGATGGLPVILERTPYDKSGISRAERSVACPEPMSRPAVAAWFAQHGYAVVMQDVRGRYQSGGRFAKYVNEAGDGFDTVAWIMRQPWCNGRVGTMGLSYGAHAQMALACLAPPGLACMFMDSGGFASAYAGGIRRGGAFELKQATWAYRHARLSPRTAADPARRAALDGVDLIQWFRDMPWWPGHSPLAAAPEYEAYLFEQWREGSLGKYWQRAGLWAEGYYDAIPDVPIAIIGSWYDPYASTCTRNFAELARRKRGPVRLVMGPWTHGDRSQTFAGDVDFGPAATLDGNLAPDYLALRLAWFDQWLAGNRRQAEALGAPVTYFEMGGGRGGLDAAGRLRHGGRWRHSGAWPPGEADGLRLFLHVGGRLHSAVPESDSAFAEYRFDPRNPVPTLGGALTSGDPVMSGGAFDQRVGAGTFTYRPDAPLAPLCERADVLSFVTEPLAEDLVVTGEVRAELWVSTDCADTDFTIKLVDVYPPGEGLPQGFAMNVTDGIFRLRYREGWDREAAAEPGRPYRIEVRAFPTSNRFCRGHRLRLDVSSSNYPQFDINPNTGGPQGGADAPRIATNRVYLCRDRPSRLLLDVLPALAQQDRDGD